MKYSMLAIAFVLAPSCAPAPQEAVPPNAPEHPVAAAAEKDPVAPAATLELGSPAEAGVPGVAASVNGFDITENAVEEEILVIVRAQTQGQGVPPEQMEAIRAQLFPRVLERMIEDRLLDEEVDRQAVTVSPEELRAAMAQNFEGYVLSTRMPRAFVEEQIQDAEGLTIEQFIEKRSGEEGFRRFVLHKRLVCKLHPAETTVGAEEVEAQYTLKAASDFTFPTNVRASHILIGTQDLDAQAKQAALEQAQALRARAIEPGADFAALAREHSICPSKTEGGDLGYFQHEAMVKPFSEAAFALSVGAVSEVVESQFGFHIILVTDRSEGRTLPLAEATNAIHDELEIEKVDQMRATVLAKLRETAKIEYGAAAKG